MALFRMLCIEFQNNIPSLDTLMARLMWMQLGMIMGLASAAGWAITLYGSSNLYEFCRGSTTKVQLTVLTDLDELG